MSCEKYKSRIADTAAAANVGADVGAGFSPPSISDPELSAHLKTCAACRAEFEAQLALLGSIDRGLAAMVEGEPSGDFAAHVRRRIEQQAAAPRPWFAGWVPVTAGALALIVLVTFWMMRRNGPVPETAKDKAPPTKISQPPREPQMAGKSPAVSPPSNTSGAQKHRPPREPQMATKYPPAGPPALTGRPPREPQMAATREPEVLVPRGEIAAVTRLMNSNWSGKSDGASLTAQVAPMSENLKPISIEQLKIPALEVIPLDSGEQPKGSPEK